MAQLENYLFPRGFVWGAATASYQIEGGFNQDGKGASIWDTFSHIPGRIANGDTGDTACDHYHRYAEDCEIMKQIGLKAYRFSISWPRVLPDGRGVINNAGLDFYDRLVDTLLSHRIEPYVTLFHWDLPQVLQDEGGWYNRDTAGYFADYAALMTKRLGDRVRKWITINEPRTFAVKGNLTGEHAPGLTDRKVACQAAHNMLLGHGLAMQAIRGADPDSEVGIAVGLAPKEANNDSPEAIAAAELRWKLDDAWFLDPLFRGCYPPEAIEALGKDAPQAKPGDFAVTAQKMDFLGVNYYFRILTGSDGKTVAPPKNARKTAMGWEICPEAFGRLLTQLQNDYYGLPPIFITENGAAFDDKAANGQVHDPQRVEFMRDHLTELRDAMRRGISVKGYFAWSLMDNFEWACGYAKRFGLVHVDFKSQKRILKDSAHWYSRVIASNELDLCRTE